VLNASRHHRYSHDIVGLYIPALGMCSTPRGITGTLTERGIKDVDAHWDECSTPRGITGTLTPVYVVDTNGAIPCSTPRGITGTLTSEDSKSRYRRSQCSTPRGITGTLTPNFFHFSTVESQVLNASRHHRYSHSIPGRETFSTSKCSTPRGITGTLTNDAPCAGTPRFSAQRLAASQVLSHNGIRSATMRLWVLNASRHHRYSHLF